jgi:hypothetical protein
MVDRLFSLHMEWFQVHGLCCVWLLLPVATGLVAHWLQQKPNLVYLLELASDQLYRLSCKGGPSPEASSLIQLFLHYHCMGK